MAVTLLPLIVWALSSLTLTTGVGAGVVYAPMFVLVFDLDLPSAVATSILIQLAGVGTTAIGHFSSPTTDRALAIRLGAVGAIGVVAAWLIRSRVPVPLAEAAFVVGIAAVGLWLLKGTRISVRLPTRRVGATPRPFGGLPEYEFCRPAEGYGLAGIAGAATATLGISGAEIQITALMLRCRVPTVIAIRTGTVAAALTLVVAGALAVGSAQVEWALLLIGVPSAVLGSLTARRLARRLPGRGLRVGLGLLVLLSSLGVALRELLI
jgi:uncharacterized membrane protein YfcA